MKIKIVVTFDISENREKQLANLIDGTADVTFLTSLEENEKRPALSSADVLFTWNPNSELKNFPEDLLKNLKFVQLLSAGYDHLDFSYFPADCIIAANQGAYAEPMAEHTVAMIAALSKKLFVNHHKMTEGEFPQLDRTRSLKGSVCGIIGFGSIGKASAKLLKPFGVKIWGINTTGETEEDIEFIGTLEDLDQVLKNSDSLIISIPLNDKTRGLIGKRELDLMKNEAILINVARGPVIKEKDFYEHLKSHPDFFAGIDAWWSEPLTTGKFETNYPFFELPNLIGSPHNSAVVPGSLWAGAELAADNVLNFIRGNKVNGIISR